MTNQSSQRSDDKTSVGVVIPQSVDIKDPLKLACGQVFNQYHLVYETYGVLNTDKTNAILICHALSGHHHAAGFHTDNPQEKPGWWDSCIGPGKPIDTNKFFVVVPNNIGGCHGTTGPSSINPETNKAWGPDFPPLRFRDWVDSQAQLADHLGIQVWAAIIGGSLGGMQAMRWSLEYPDRVKHCLVIASAMNLTPQNIAFNEMARQAIISDPNFCGGRYLDEEKKPVKGLALARMIGHVTYLSQSQLEDRFGRDLREGSFERGNNNPVQFEIESYLNYKGDQFAETFDANTYLVITRMLDVFDLAREYNHDPVVAFSNATCKYFVASFSTDWRFAPDRSKEIVNALVAAKKEVTYVNIETDRGHDGFLSNTPRYIKDLTSYLTNVANEVNEELSGAS
jgi:homoserine O-acetyltransferase/O-succinyltransferase